jgi:hypothetical protein
VTVSFQFDVRFIPDIQRNSTIQTPAPQPSPGLCPVTGKGWDSTHSRLFPHLEHPFTSSI